MKIMVISDLHICNGDDFSTFGWEDDDFVARLELYRQVYEIDSVILNGDIFEMYKYSYPDIYKHHYGLIDYLVGSRCVFIRGNHDSAFFPSVDDLTMVGGEGRLIHIEHGHKADSSRYLFVRLFHKCVFRILKFLSILKILHLFIRRMGERYENFDRIRFRLGRYALYAERLLDDLYDVVITGHTHNMEAVECHTGSGLRLFLNSGTCSQGRFQAVVLDTETLDYFFIKDRKEARMNKAFRPEERASCPVV